jgi:hypothetical protein
LFESDFLLTTMLSQLSMSTITIKNGWTNFYIRGGSASGKDFVFLVDLISDFQVREPFSPLLASPVHPAVYQHQHAIHKSISPRYIERSILRVRYAAAAQRVARQPGGGDGGSSDSRCAA